MDKTCSKCQAALVCLTEGKATNTYGEITDGVHFVFNCADCDKVEVEIKMMGSRGVVVELYLFVRDDCPRLNESIIHTLCEDCACYKKRKFSHA